jgi:hypothetical protein
MLALQLSEMDNGTARRSQCLLERDTNRGQHNDLKALDRGQTVVAVRNSSILEHPVAIRTRVQRSVWRRQVDSDFCRRVRYSALLLTKVQQGCSLGATQMPNLGFTIEVCVLHKTCAKQPWSLMAVHGQSPTRHRRFHGHRCGRFRLFPGVHAPLQIWLTTDIGD